MTIPGEPPDSHPGSETVAAFLDGALSSSEAATVEEHFADCAACRLEFAEVHSAIMARRRRRRLIVAGPLVAAAAVLLLVLRLPPTPAPVGTLRSDSSSGVPAGGAIEVVSPVREVAVPAAGLAFRWRAAAAEPVRYALTLTDEQGNPLWSMETGDTVAVLPGTVVLSRDRTYLWYVDARLPGARSASSGIREFRTTP